MRRAGPCLRGSPGQRDGAPPGGARLGVGAHGRAVAAISSWAAAEPRAARSVAWSSRATSVAVPGS
eukprot:1737295-Alexandrium_andersonii.AAC.1